MARVSATRIRCGARNSSTFSGQGYQREAAEERLKDLFEVSALSQITKGAATKMIDELLASAPGNGGGGNGAAARHQR